MTPRESRPPRRGGPPIRDLQQERGAVVRVLAGLGEHRLGPASPRCWACARSTKPFGLVESLTGDAELGGAARRTPTDCHAHVLGGALDLVEQFAG